MEAGDSLDADLVDADSVDVDSVDADSADALDLVVSEVSEAN